jgi:hypothetical protein
MIAGMFDVEPSSMLDPSKNFVERVKRIHERYT